MNENLVTSAAARAVERSRTIHITVESAVIHSPTFESPALCRACAHRLYRRDGVVRRALERSRERPSSMRHSEVWPKPETTFHALCGQLRVPKLAAPVLLRMHRSAGSQSIACNDSHLMTASARAAPPHSCVPAADGFTRTVLGRVMRRTLPALVLLACSKGEATTSDSSSASGDSAAAVAEETRRPALALPVGAEDARDGDLVLRVSTTGQVRSDAVVKLRSAVEGTVSHVLVRPGARVSRGQPIVRFDPYPFDLAVREAQAVADESEQRFFESFVPESLVTGKGPTAELRKALMNKAGLTGARLRLDRARYEQTRATVSSPVNGVIDAVDVAPGERVGAGQSLLTVVDTRNLRIEAQVLEHDLPLVRAGGEATVTSVGAPGRTIRGRVETVLPLVDSVTRAGRAIVRVYGDGTLRPGMYADVQLESARLRDRRLVPARAVIERDGRPLVFVVKDGRAQWTYINPGRSNGADTEVLPDSATGQIPINAGDKIIVDGHLTLTHDAPVRIAVPREPSASGSAVGLPRKSR